MEIGLKSGDTVREPGMARGPVGWPWGDRGAELVMTTRSIAGKSPGMDPRWITADGRCPDGDADKSR